MPIVTKPYGDFVNNVQTADANQVNAQFNALYNLVNGGLDSANLATNGLNDSTKFAKEVVTQDKTKGLVYAQDLFTNSFVLSGGVATKDGTSPNTLDVTAIVAYIIQPDGSTRRINNQATNFSTTVPNTTYYLDLNPDGSWSWGTAHTQQQNYLAIAQVTTDGAGNISTVTDKRNTSVVTTLALNSQQAWIAPTLLNGWTNFGGPDYPAGYMKDSMGFVHLRGHLSGGTTTNNTVLFNLPAGYRPSKNYHFTGGYITNGGGWVPCQFCVDSSGNVKIDTNNTAIPAGATIHIENGHFLAEQ